MIISGYERPVEYGRLLIFDPTMAAMVLQAQQQYNAALKDEYEKGLKDLADFNTKYGDFISPFSRDMDRYGEMIGGIRNVLDEAYAKGINLTQSPQGRMIIQRLTNSINPAEFNTMRTNAKLGFEYLDAIEKAKAKNEFDENFENWSLTHGGPGLFSEFSSAGGKMWNRPAPYVYQDLNKYTGHIFDKLDDSFIRTGEDHYDYYGVTREDRAKALTSHLSGLLQSPLGRFHYENSKAAAERALGRRLTDQEAMQVWQSDILDATHEYDHENRKLNELWKLQQENAARRASGGSGSRTTGAYPWSFAEVVRRNAATSIMGQQIQEYSNNTLAGVRDEMIKFGKEVSSNTGGHSFKYAGKQAFKQKYGLNSYGVQDINNFLAPQGFNVIDERTGTMLMPKQLISRLKTEDDVISNTVGFRGRSVSSDNRWLDNADIITITPTTGSYGALMKNNGAARFENQFEMDVVAYKNVPAVDKDGKPLYNDNGTRQMTRKVIGKKRRYLDSHITSTANAQGTGWLGTRDIKGNIKDTKNLTVTNTQDHRYQDAIQGDKAATEAIIKGTGYISDGIPSELPEYGR